MYRTIAAPAPANAESYKSIRWVGKEVIGGNGKPQFYLDTWKGRSKKPKCYAFRTAEGMAQYLNYLKEQEDRREEIFAKRRADDSAQLAKMVEAIQVGTILYYSWGYDQTNIDFFQVVGKRKRTVTIRPIAGHLEPGASPYAMQGTVSPIKDHFIGAEVLTKRISPYGLKMDYGHASPTNGRESFHCSWDH